MGAPIVKWLTPERLFTIVMTAFTIGGVWAVTQKTVGDLTQEVSAVRDDLKDVRSDLRSLSQDNGAKTLEMARYSFRIDALERRNDQLTDLIEFQRASLGSLRERLAANGWQPPKEE